MRARWAASSFCFTPPIGSTRPVRDTSPVMATSERTSRPDSSDARAVVIVTPALGPSLGTAPAGTWTCTPRAFTSPTGSSSSAPWERREDSAIWADAPLQRARPGLAGVLGGQGPQRVVGDGDVGRVQPGPLQLAGQQVALGDGDLLGLGVAVQADGLHPVHQRLGDGLGHVGGGDE